MSLRFGRLTKISFLSLILAPCFCLVGVAQTFNVGGKPAQKEQEKPGQASPQGQQLGWGSSIQNARLARAATDALNSHNYAAAVNYAQHAVEAAPNDPQLWLLLGYAARMAGKSQLSLQAYQKGLQLAPSSLDALGGMARTYNSMGQRAEAIRLLTQATNANPKRVEDLLMLGDLLLQSQQYDQALTALGKAEQVSPSARAELLMATCYRRLNQRDKANHYLDLAKRRAPSNPDVRRALASFYRESGDYASAIAALKPVANVSPDIKAELAYTYQLAGKKDEAAKLYVQAADSAPKQFSLQLSAAEAQIGAGNTEAATKYAKRAAALQPGQYHLHALQGELARLDERNDDAIQEYKAALAAIPEAPQEGPLYRIQLRMNLLSLYKQTNDSASAQQQLQEAQNEINALSMDGSAEFLRLRALIKLNAGDLQGARADVDKALAINSKDINTMELDGDVLAKIGDKKAAMDVYRKVLAADPSNQAALTSIGYVAREMGDDAAAIKYFQRLAATHPKSYVAYLALGDVYGARRDFAKAEAAYNKAHDRAPQNPLVIAGGMNVAIETHHLPTAANWLKLATPAMRQDPHLMRQEERYLNWVGKYQESADVGHQVIKKLPNDRDVVVYLGYDLLHLQKYDELFQLTQHYSSILPKEADIPLLTGYVDKHNGRLEEAEQDFTATLKLDPDVVTAYVNRGYVRNDLRKPADAATDFEAAIKREPNNGEAHLGLAFSSLSLHRPSIALHEVQIAQKQLGDSLSVHLIRATAYGQQSMLGKAADEYRAAIHFSPNDPALHLGLANALYGLHQYRNSLGELELAERLAPEKGIIEANMSRCYAQLGERENALRYVKSAEQQGPDGVFLITGQALSLLGEQDAAMDRFTKALNAPKSDRIEVRLAIARIMLAKGEWSDARRQIALGLMEANIGETLPPTGEELMQAANTFLGMHEFQLAKTFFERARAAGASDVAVRVGLANTYLALGDTPRARGELASISSFDDADSNYQYLLTKGNMLLQEHHNPQALTAFAQAAAASGEDETADRQLLQAGGSEGMRINDKLSLMTDTSVTPIFEDTTVYPLDAKLDVTNPIPGRQGLLPLPRSSLETQWTGAYHLHLPDLPPASGFFRVRNDRGAISLPSANAIVNRDTTDYSLNFALNPTVNLGDNVITFSSGIEGTFRRDSEDPVHMDQNLFRQFVYMSTSSFFNIISVDGYAIHESGPFTEQHLHSSDVAGQINFRVGTPWGKTALVTGWGARNLQFSPVAREFFLTSTYAGIERKIGSEFKFRVVAEHLRSWRVENGTQWAIAQALRPAFHAEYRPTRNWSVQGSVAFSNNMGFHDYDAVQSGFAVSYERSVRRVFSDDTGSVPLRYPIRFSAGMQQENFFNFNGGSNNQFRPYVSITIF